MTEEDLVPKWARELAEEIASMIEFEAPAILDCQQSEPEETEWGVDLVELWPAVMEIQEAGPNDGEIVYGIVHSFDILAAQKIFDKVNSVKFGFEIANRPIVTIEGNFKGRPVVVIVYFEPEFEDDEDTELDS